MLVIDTCTHFCLVNPPSPQARFLKVYSHKQTFKNLWGSLRRQKHVQVSLIMTFCFMILPVINAFAVETPFKPGERIVYNIQQMGVKAGEATLEFKGERHIQGRTLLLIIFTADGFNFYDQERIFLDPATYKPVVVTRDLNIFGSKERIIEKYQEQPGHIVIKKESGNRQTVVVLDNKSGIDNLYGFIYRYRLTGSFKVGDKLDIHLPTKDISIELKRQVKLSAAGKVFDSYYMQSDPAKYKLWFDAGPNKLPLRISGAIGIANTVMVMKEYHE